MRSNGSIYVSSVFALLAFYFAYQWWFNPSRAVKRQMGEIAAALSVPPAESDVARLSRLAQLRRYLADDLRVRAGTAELASRDKVFAVLNALKPPAGIDVRFVDTQVFIDSDVAARSYMSVEIATPTQGVRQPTIDRLDTSVRLEKRNGQWLVTNAEAKEPRPVQ